MRGQEAEFLISCILIGGNRPPLTFGHSVKQPQGPLDTLAKGRDHVTMRALDSYSKVILLNKVLESASCLSLGSGSDANSGRA